MRRMNGPAVGRVFGAIVVMVLCTFTAGAQVFPNPEIHAQLLKGIEYAGQQRYSQARTVFDDVIRLVPDHPAGYLNKVILLEVMSLDFETPVPQPEFDRLIEKAELLAQRMLDRNEKSAEGKYYLGMTHSYLAYYKFRDGENWVSGLKHGMSANSWLEECVELDPKAWDAMTGVGTYKYWKSRKMSFLTWSPFVDDERAEGIRILRDAERRAAYTGAQATNSLIWIYIEEERYAEAIRCAQSVLKRFPANRLFLWGLASAAEKTKHWQLAREAYQRIEASVDEEVLERRYIDVQARSKIARMSFQLGDRESARRECDWVLANGRFDTSPFTSDGVTRIRKRVADMEKLQAELKQ